MGNQIRKMTMSQIIKKNANLLKYTTNMKKKEGTQLNGAHLKEITTGQRINY